MREFAGPIGLVSLLVALLSSSSPGSEEVANFVGSPTTVAVEPSASTLEGPRATRQLIVSASYPDGTVRDLTRALRWESLNPEVAVVSTTGRVVPSADGTATIVAKLGAIEARTTVSVRSTGGPAPVSFRRDVIPALSQAGCNAGACHGTPTGKGGFKLSLRGYLPDQDYITLSREAAARRVDPFAPESSMLLSKPLGEQPHEGGQKLFRGTKTYEFLRDWIAEGLRDDPASPSPTRIEMLPGARVLDFPARTQQVVVLAHGPDGTIRDVTPICYFQASNSEIAEVDAGGFVTFKMRGEVAIIAHYLDLVANVRLSHRVEVPGFRPTEVPTDDRIDAAVFAKLNRLRIAPSGPCTDGEFVRRAFLDAIGVLPSPSEIQTFLSEPTTGRRERLVERLMARPEFADFWALKFADILRSNARLIQAKGALAYHRWIKANLERNTPIDRLVRDLLAADGSSWSNPAANYYRISRDPENSVETTAQLFLGVRIQCAKCHNHPSERWTQDDYYGFAAFFSQVGRKKGAQPEEEFVYSTGAGEVSQPRSGKVMRPKALGGPVLEPLPGGDRRDGLAAWLTAPENPFFARSFVNRVWFHLMGRGIVDPVDDFRDSNPASNDELLDGLAADFVRGGFDLRKLVRSILVSRTYGLSAQSVEGNAGDVQYFSHAYTKLLPAEVLLDAISTVTGTSTPFDGLPRGTHATQIPDGKMENPFLKTFGRPARELACECERESDANLSQALQLIGGATVNGKLRDDNGRIAALAKEATPPEDVAKELYLRALSREPEPSETAAAVKHLSSAPDRRQAIEDLGWVLINSKEFLFRH